MHTRATPVPLRIIQLPIAIPEAKEQRYFATMLKLKLRVYDAAPHLERHMLEIFLQKLLPVTCRNWLHKK